MQKVIFLYLAIFIAGILSALLASSYLISNIWSRASSIQFGNQVLQAFYIESAAQNAVTQIELSKKGDLNGLLRHACFQLKIYAEYIDPELYSENPEKRAEIQNLKINANALQKQLQYKGQCEQSLATASENANNSSGKQNKLEAKSLADFIKTSIVLQNNNIVGFRIRPGFDPEQFYALGLKDNDIITSVNGISINSSSHAIDVFMVMKTINKATFELLRDGEALELDIGPVGAKLQ